MSTGQDSVVNRFSLEDAIALIVIPPSDETRQLVKIISAVTPSHGYTVPGWYARKEDGNFELIISSDDCCGEVIKIGEILFGDLNSGEAGTTQDFIFADAIPDGDYFARGFIKTNIAFVSYSGSPLNIDSISPVADNKSIKAINSEFELQGTDVSSIISNDVKVTVSFGGGANPQDWTAGKASVYVQVVEFPTLV